MKELKSRIREAVSRELSLKVRETEFTEYKEEDGTPVVRVDVWLSKENEKIGGDLYFRLIPLVANTVREAEIFDAFPLVKPHLARGQEINSKLLKT
ncbi:MAG: hypothetical protein ISQ19_04475 [PS1 clade bacterium]|uniref:Uncharacterized protein n=1 Tax=PS1 clade bacterium TaxID=2175152 RepID=A0A937HGV8_9PROT|nr:hypothetical protein [PS1 clade bacterium]